MSCIDCCFRTVRWIPVVFIVAVICWSYYAYVVQLLVVTIPGDQTAIKVILGIVYHMFLFMFGWAYYKIAFTDPSGPPIKFYLSAAQVDALRETELHQDREAGGKLLEEYVKSLPVVTRTHNQGVRYCDQCKLIKPDRAHHCSVCKTCVLKMDHHCPWVNNCVSFSNYKFFILFLFYAELYCLFVAISDARYFVAFWTGLGQEGGTNFHVMFLFIVSIMFSLSVIGLLGYHLYLVCRNQTTLESFRAPVFHVSGPDKHGFDLGRAGNWRFIFGDNPRLWFIPVQTHKGDGVQYPTRGEFRTHTYNYSSMDDNALPNGGDAEYGGGHY